MLWFYRGVLRFEGHVERLLYPPYRVLLLQETTKVTKPACSATKIRGRCAFVKRNGLMGVLVQVYNFASSARCALAHSGLNDFFARIMVLWWLLVSRCAPAKQGCARAHVAKRFFCHALFAGWWHAVGACIRAQKGYARAHCLKIRISSLLCNFASKPPFFT